MDSPPTAIPRFAANIAILGVCAALVVATLSLADMLVARAMPGFNAANPPLVAAAIFLIAAIPFSLLIDRFPDWNRPQLFFLVPLGLFLPILFWSHLAGVAFGADRLVGNEVLLADCAPGEAFCGDALALSLMIGLLRAAPTVVIVPPVYWWLRKQFLQGGARG